MPEKGQQLTFEEAAEWDSAKPLAAGEVQLKIIPVETAEGIASIIMPEVLAD